MDLQKFTQQVQQTIADAQNLAIASEHQEIDVAHVFKVLLTESDFAKRVYDVAEVDIDALQKTVEDALTKNSCGLWKRCKLWSSNEPSTFSVDAGCRKRTKTIRR